MSFKTLLATILLYSIIFLDAISYFNQLKSVIT